MLVIPGLAEVEVANTDDGVKLVVTATDPERVEVVQNHAERGVANLQRIAERMGERARRADLPPGLFGWVARGDVELALQKTDEGAVLECTSDKPDVVQGLQEQMPQWVAEAEEQGDRLAELRERMRGMREALELLANEGVTIEVEETDDGITVQVTSEDPDLAAEIKEKLPAYYEGQKEFARTADERGFGAGPFGPGGPMGAGPGAGRRPRGAGRRPRAEPEL
jgi:hypothetical protein